MPNATCATVWNGAIVEVSAALVPRYLWQSASIEVAVSDHTVLQTGGVLTFVGSRSESFLHEGVPHTAEVKWGKAALRSFPFVLNIDGTAVLESRVPVTNWWLSLWPIALLLAFLAWRFAI